MKIKTNVAKTEEFAEVEIHHSQNNGDEKKIDIETISLSSEEEEVKAVVLNKPTRCIERTPKSSEKRLLQNLSIIKKGRKQRNFPLQYKYHKINEYFQATKKYAKNEAYPSDSEQPSSNAIQANKMNSIMNSQEILDVQRFSTNLKQVKIVLRRLSIDQNVDTTRKRKVQNDQFKLSEITGENYFTTHEQSTLPKHVQIQSQVIESSSIHPKVEIEIVAHNSSDGANSHGICINDEQIDSSSTISRVELKFKPKIDSSKYHLRKKLKKTNNVESMKKVTNKIAINIVENMSKKSVTRKPRVDCPYYKIIEGTRFAVDAFRYGDIEGVEHYFLTHFHADHYIGLKKSFNHKLYVSNISGRLVMKLIKVEEQYIRFLDINTPIIVDEIEVTALDANHCPGAVMYLFKLKTGKCILHTGDFRASPDMEEFPEFWNNEMDTIYLDTTYLSSKYEFPTQSDSIALIIQYCHEFVSRSSSSAGKHLIICGAYKVGKEKVWLRIAQEFKYKVWINEDRQKVIQCIQNDEISDVLTRYAKDASIHVLPLGHISYQFIVDYVRQFDETFCRVLAIRPSGWEKQKSKPNFSNKITVLPIQYSEHSNYSELERFVRFLQPKKVISTVPICSKNLNKTPKIPEAWLGQKLEPKSKSYQKNIMDFMVKVVPTSFTE